MRTAVYRTDLGHAWPGGPQCWITSWRVGNRLCETISSSEGNASAVMFMDLYPEDQNKSLDDVLSEIYAVPHVRIA